MTMCGPLLLILGLMQVTADQCSEQVAQLQQKEKDLKMELEKQEELLQRLQQTHSPQRGPTDAQKGPTAQPPEDTLFKDCSDVFGAGFRASGFYRVRPESSPTQIRVFCDMSGSGGWTVIQRRTDGSQRFNRSWEEYKDGFGDFETNSGEFWLGNNKLNQLTSQGNYSLRIHLEDFEGNQRYAEYQGFRVADEQALFQLTFGAYVGTAGDALSGGFEVGASAWASHQGANFSTYDRDSDNYRGNCAQEDQGGWWFNKCHSAHLNGQYYPGGHYSSWSDSGIVWFPWRGWWYSLKTSVMKIRPVYRPGINQD